MNYQAPIKFKKTFNFSFAAFNLLMLLLFSLGACSGTKHLKKNPSAKANFSANQMATIWQSDTSTPMRVLKITNKQDSILLRTKCENVQISPADSSLQHFVKRLYRTVRDSMSMGVGIAAPQVGILKNIIWVQRFDKENFPFEVYLNPAITQYTVKKRPCLEGCLSIPDRSDTTQTRSYAILLEYDRLDGTHNYEMVEDFTAIVFQHEVDHLNGILYIDHLNEEMREAEE